MPDDTRNRLVVGLGGLLLIYLMAWFTLSGTGDRFNAWFWGLF